MKIHMFLLSFVDKCSINFMRLYEDVFLLIRMVIDFGYTGHGGDFYQDGKYLICQRAYDGYVTAALEVPDGKAEDGETLETAHHSRMPGRAGRRYRGVRRGRQDRLSDAGSDLEFAFFQHGNRRRTLAATMLDPAALPTRVCKLYRQAGGRDPKGFIAAVEYFRGLS